MDDKKEPKEESKKEKKDKTIYNLGLHERITVIGEDKEKVEIMRVPGGWVYMYEFPGFRQAPIVFVPFSKEDVR